MVTVLAVLGVLVVLFAAAAVATRDRPLLADAPPDRPDLELPDERPLQAEDVAGVRFGMTLRGYRMSEVDQVLDRVAEELAERDARVRRLEAQLGSASPDEDGSEPLPPVHVQPGAAPPLVPFPEPVHVDEPVDVPPAPEEDGLAARPRGHG